MPSRVNVKSGGTTPTGEITITENGQYDVSSYALADVNVVDNSLAEEMAKGTITAINSTAITQLRRYAFSDCKSLVSVNLPNVTSFPSNVYYGQYAFQNCTALTNLEPMYFAQSIPAGFLYNCSNLERAEFPNATNTNVNIFAGCSKLKYVNLGNTIDMGLPSTWSNCNSLETVVINGKPSISSTTLLPNNPTFYVKDEYLSWFETATNWSVLYTNGKVKGQSQLPS